MIALGDYKEEQSLSVSDFVFMIGVSFLVRNRVYKGNIIQRYVEARMPILIRNAQRSRTCDDLKPSQFTELGTSLQPL